MNELRTRQGPSLRYILPRFRTEFEQDVLYLYYQAVSTEHTYVPVTTDDLAVGHPKFLVSAIQAKWFQLPDYYWKQVEGMNEQEEIEYVKKTLIYYSDDDDYNNQYFSLLNDISIIMDHHHMSYVEVLPSRSGPRRFLQNPPLAWVW